MTKRLPDQLQSALATVQQQMDSLLASDRYREMRATLEAELPYSQQIASERLNSILSSSAKDVPNYANLRHLTNPRLEDFPLTRKADIRRRPFDFIARDRTGRVPAGTLSIAQTSGSTGEPVATIRTVEGDGLRDTVIEERMRRSLDLPLTGTALNLSLMTFNPYALLQPVLLPRPYVQWNLRGFDRTDPEIVEEYAAIVGAFHIDLIEGTASRIISLAAYCNDHDIRLRPSAVITSYEHMPDSGRRMVQETFQCKVTSLYGTAETGLVGWECASRRFHAQNDLVVVEILDDHGEAVPSGVRGNVTLTSLKSSVMPMVRYVSGDLAQGLEECDCGSPHLAFPGLVGRARVRLVGASGEFYSPYSLVTALSREGIPDFQILQEEPGRLKLLTRTELAVDGVVEKINATMAARVGEDELVLEASATSMVLTSRGKRNPVVQRIESTDSDEDILRSERSHYV